MQSQSIKAPTKAERKRMSLIVEIGCIACIMDGKDKAKCGPPTVHHLLDGGVRRGHSFTICLGAWHHQGYPRPLLSRRQATELWGPSLAEGSKPFHAKYGTDSELLEYQNHLISESL